MFGRGPTKKDIDMALVLLGYDSAGVPTELTTTLAEQRLVRFAAAGHHPTNLSGFVSELSPELLKLTAAEARGRMAKGESLLNR